MTCNDSTARDTPLQNPLHTAVHFWQDERFSCKSVLLKVSGFSVTAFPPGDRMIESSVDSFMIMFFLNVVVIPCY
jgi:hypothetical protein